MDVTTSTRAPHPALSLMAGFVATQRRRIGGAVVAGIFTILSSVALLSVSAWLIERASQRPPILALMVAIVAVRFFGIGRGVFRYVDRYLSHDASFRLLGTIRGNIYQALIPLAPSGLRQFGSGEVLARVAGDVDQMQDWFVRGFAPVCISVVTLMVVAVAAALVLPAAGAVLFTGLVAAGFIVTIAARTSGDNAAREMTLRGQVIAGTVGYIQGIADLIALGAVDDMTKRIEEAERARDVLLNRRALGSAVATGLQAALPGLLAVAVGIAAVTAGHRLNPLAIGVLVFGAMAAAECTAALPGAVQAWERGVAAAGRLAEIIEHPMPAATGALTLCDSPRRIEVRDVTFRYGVAEPWVLHGVSFGVSIGERILIVGSSGAGKSTLASLLLRFLCPTRGSIELAGVDIQNVTEPSLRTAIGAATQDAHLFAGTIRDNILLARPEATDNELRAAVVDAQLAEWVDGLPEGWNTQVGERGVAVSGGQRRRIALARALLAGFPFLIADEPTEGLDEATAREVMAALFSTTDRRGLIVITHRPDLCPPADAVYTLSNGELTAATP